MWCPSCASENSKVLNTQKGPVNERYRRCKDCGFTFLSIEQLKVESLWFEYAKHIIETEAPEHVKQKIRGMLEKEGIDPRQGSLF